MIVAHVRGHRVRAEALDEHAQASWLHRIDARAKLVGILGFVIICALMTNSMLIFSSLVLSVLFAGLSQIPGKHLVKAYLGALPFILIASVSVSAFSGPERGLDMWGRTSACVIPLLVLASGTETYELFSGLRRLHMPTLIATLLMLTYKYLLLMSEEMARMSIARRARGFRPGKSLLDRYGLSVLSYTAGMIFVRSSDRGERSYEGLRARGFRKEFPIWSSSRIGVPDISFMAVFLVLSVALVSLQLGVVL